MVEAPERILDLKSLRLPPSPRVAELTVYPFVDSVGDPALRVTVAVDTTIDSGEWIWKNLKPIEEEIFRALREAGDTRWPYVRFLTLDDYEADRRESPSGFA